MRSKASNIFHSSCTCQHRYLYYFISILYMDHCYMDTLIPWYLEYISYTYLCIHIHVLTLCMHTYSNFAYAYIQITLVTCMHACSNYVHAYTSAMCTNIGYKQVLSYSKLFQLFVNFHQTSSK